MRTIEEKKTIPASVITTYAKRLQDAKHGEGEGAEPASAPTPEAVKVLILVEGGCVQNVYANTDVNVTVIDRDNEDGDMRDIGQILEEHNTQKPIW